MKLLDWFCGAGAAAIGYHNAGFDEIIGIDYEFQPNYPFEFHRLDVRKVMTSQVLIDYIAPDAIHASPPCQGYSSSTLHLNTQYRPKLIPQVRAALQELGIPYVIENVPGAPMEWDNTIMLCGTMFGKQIRRHRYFEFSYSNPTNFPWPCDHSIECYTTHSQGNSEYRKRWMEEMELALPFQGRKVMTQREAMEAIPPYYAEYVGLLLKAQISR